MQAKLNPNTNSVILILIVILNTNSVRWLFLDMANENKDVIVNVNIYEHLTSEKKFKQKRGAAKTNKIPTKMKIYTVIHWKNSTSWEIKHWRKRQVKDYSVFTL